MSTLQKSKPRARVGSSAKKLARPIRFDKGPLELELDYPNGTACVLFEPPDESLERLARQVSTVLIHESRVGGSIRTPRSAHQVASTARSFMTFMAKRPHSATGFGLDKLLGDEVDDYQRWAQRNADTKGSAIGDYRAGMLVWLLRRAQALGLELTEAMSRRLPFGVKKTAETKPLEPYSEQEDAKLQELFDEHLKILIKRLTVEGPRRLSQGRNPESNGWISEDNQLWEINRIGVLSQLEIYRRGGSVASSLTNGSLTDLHRLLYPSVDDLAAPFAMFVRLTGMEPESVRDLRVDSIKNRNKGKVEIEYVKRRAHKKAYKTMRVRDGDISTAGGLFRAIVRLTENVRRHTGLPNLWQFYGNGRFRSFDWSSVVYERMRKLIAASAVMADDGRRLSFDVRRLRKTHKAARYQKVSGRMTAFVKNHTPDVAAARYANVEALRPLHEQAIESALNQAAAVAEQPIVLTPPEEDRAKSDDAEAKRLLNMDSESAKKVLGRESDLWLNSCADFYDSPFGEKGNPCPVPFHGCLECGNCVITRKKLPAILSFLGHICEARTRTPSDEWHEKFGLAWARIMQQILPSYSSDDLLAAKCVAEGEGKALRHLPSALFDRS